MKRSNSSILAFSALSLSLVSPLAQAQDKVDMSVFTKLVGMNCKGGGNPLSAKLAMQIARATTENGADGKSKVDVSAFEQVWQKSCDYEFSIAAASENNGARVDLDQLEALHSLRCKTRDGREGALGKKESIAAALVANKSPKEFSTFSKIWQETCSFDGALSLAKQETAGTIDIRVFFNAYREKCQTVDKHVGATSFGVAAKIATLKISAPKQAGAYAKAWLNSCGEEFATRALKEINARSIDIDVLVDAYRASRREDQAVTYAIQEKEGQFKHSAFQAVIGKRCRAEGSSRVSIDFNQASQIALLAIGKFDVGSFLEAFTVSCDYDVSKSIGMSQVVRSVATASEGRESGEQTKSVGSKTSADTITQGPIAKTAN